MILHMGVRTTDPVKVAYKPLEPDEDETSAIAELLGKLTVYHFFDPSVYDHFHGRLLRSPGSTSPRRELLVPVPGDIRGSKRGSSPR